MSSFADFASGQPGFYRKTAVDQILAFAWFAEANLGRSVFDGAYMRQCFKDAAIEPPNMSVYLPRLVAKRPPQLIREKGGYRLDRAVKRTLDSRLGGNPTTAAVTKALLDLPSKIPDIAEKEFLTESLNCYRVRAFRASIIMVWNLTYDHLTQWIFSEPARLASLNAAISGRYSKKGLVITKVEDLDGLKESEFIESARAAKLIDKNTFQILEEKLRRRNMAAHPSRVIITQHSADDMITDLVTNVVLKFN